VVNAHGLRNLDPPMFPLNLPNVLTVVRILAVPVVVVALLDETPNGDALAAAVFALAALTDGLDGYIARSRDAVTTFGKLMDPLADKLLIVAALVSLVSLGRLAAWVAMVIIAREVAVTGLRAVAAEQGVVISASWLGKLKTALQVAAVFALILWESSPLGVDLLVYAAVAATVISGADYFLGLRRRIEEERERRAGRTAAGATRTS
jgi:CDP-diacylglycerol--glycerol-3-phosphate 3-phosphatidyltransferase